MVRIIRFFLVGVVVSMFVGCASQVGTRRGWKEIPDESVRVCLTNKIPYTLRGKIIEEEKFFSGRHILSVIPADSSIVVHLVRNRKYRIEGEAFDAKGKRTGRFVQLFATVNLTVDAKGKIIMDPVVISGADFYSSGAPPLFGFVINTRPDSLVIRVCHPQRPGVKYDLLYSEYAYLTIVAEPKVILTVQYCRPDGTVLWTQKFEHTEFDSNGPRGRIFWDGRKLDFKLDVH